MKVLPFTIPVPHDKTLIVSEEHLPHFYTLLHRHQEIQVTWILEGTGVLVAGTNMQAFKADEIYFMGANLPHVFKSEPGETVARSITLFFNPQTTLSALFSLPEMKQLQTFIANTQNGFKVTESSFSAVSAYMGQLLRSEGLPQLQAFIALLKHLSETPVEHPLALNTTINISDKEGVRLAGIYDYIIKNYNKPLTLGEVADQAFMTAPAFCRYFKKHTRYTLVGFLNKVRINEACRMLMSANGEGISDIAYSCGFNSLTNFNRVFKEVTGKTPRGYLK